jgi:DNA-binding GntR family transcriptional regulator
VERIVSGELAPGERIVELRLAKELGLSQSPIREALRDLSAIGLVEIQPRRGARVRKPDNKELADISLLRSEVDALAARLAAEIATEDHLESIRRHLAEMESHVDDGLLHEFAIADAEFHASIAHASGNQAVERVFRQLEPIGRTYITLTLPEVDLSTLIADHERIYQAMAAGDSFEAASAARNHQLRVAALLESAPVPAVDSA